MNPWTSQNNPGRQTALSPACAVVGLLLAIAFRGFRGFGSNAMAGFASGVLLLLIGVAGFVWSGRQTMVIDLEARCITVEDSNRSGLSMEVDS